MQWPTPDCSKAGATVQTSPAGPAMSAAIPVRTSSPGALMPSSLVIRIRMVPRFAFVLITARTGGRKAMLVIAVSHVSDLPRRYADKTRASLYAIWGIW